MHLCLWGMQSRLTQRRREKSLGEKVQLVESCWWLQTHLWAGTGLLTCDFT